MIGRGLDYSILLEGSLKLKEVSYIHSEAYASGELKARSDRADHAGYAGGGNGDAGKTDVQGTFQH